jgi:hypothetical protein
LAIELPTPSERITVLEAQIKHLEVDRTYDNAALERSEDWLYARFDELDKRLRALETKIAYAGGAIMVLQTLISVGIKLLWPGHS